MIESSPDVAEDTEALFALYGEGLFRFARSLLHRVEDAEDVVQTAFVRLMEHLARSGDRTNLRAWLFTVVANLARDRLRMRRRWLPWTFADSRGAVTEPVFDTRDPQQVFFAAARRLPPRDRLLVALRAQGLSYREIAEAAHIRPASVGQLLARAIARWRNEVEAIRLT